MRKGLGMFTKGDKEKGASLVEYALLVALIAIVAIAALRVLGTQINTQLTATADEIGGVGPGNRGNGGAFN